MRLKKDERARRHAFIDQALITETDECILWPWSKTKTGYPMIGIGLDKFYVTRIICERAYGAPSQSNLDAAHICRTPSCINKRHLRWDTRKGNIADMVLHGTRRRGDRISHSVLTEEQIREIRNSKEFHQVLADRYGVSRPHVTQIINRKRWEWVT